MSHELRKAGTRGVDFHHRRGDGFLRQIAHCPIEFALTLIVKLEFKHCIEDADAWSAAQARWRAQDSTTCVKHCAREAEPDNAGHFGEPLAAKRAQPRSVGCIGVVRVRAQFDRSRIPARWRASVGHHIRKSPTAGVPARSRAAGSAAHARLRFRPFRSQDPRPRPVGAAEGRVPAEMLSKRGEGGPRQVAPIAGCEPVRGRSGEVLTRACPRIDSGSALLRTIQSFFCRPASPRLMSTALIAPREIRGGDF